MIEISRNQNCTRMPTGMNCVRIGVGTMQRVNPKERNMPKRTEIDCRRFTLNGALKTGIEETPLQNPTGSGIRKSSERPTRGGRPLSEKPQWTEGGLLKWKPASGRNQQRSATIVERDCLLNLSTSTTSSQCLAEAHTPLGIYARHVHGAIFQKRRSFYPNGPQTIRSF